MAREEGAKAMGRLQDGKVTGEDKTVEDILMNGGETAIDFLTQLMQEAWRTRQVPQGVEECNSNASLQRQEAM